MIIYDPLAQMIIEFENEKTEAIMLLEKIENSIAKAGDASNNYPCLVDLHKKVGDLNGVIQGLDTALNCLREIQAEIDEVDMKISRSIRHSFDDTFK